MEKMTSCMESGWHCIPIVVETWILGFRGKAGFVTVGFVTGCLKGLMPEPYDTFSISIQSYGISSRYAM